MIVLKISPLGDSVMMVEVANVLSKMGHDVSLLVSKAGAELLVRSGLTLYTNPEDFPKDAVIIDGGPYLEQLPHTADLPAEFRTVGDIWRAGKGHLVTWLGRHVQQALEKTGVRLDRRLIVNPAEVKFSITPEEINQAKEFLKKIVPSYDYSRPVIILHLTAGTRNRNIAPSTAATIVRRLEHEKAGHVCLLPPLPDGAEYEKLPGFRLPSISLSQLPAVLAAADVCIMPDTGPAHIAAASRRWGSEKGMIWLTGSSNPFALAYPGNQWVMAPPSSCPILPCGWHGYTNPPEKVNTGRDDVMTVKQDDKRAGCIFEYYLEDKFAPCMARIDTEAVVEKVMMALK